MSDKTLLVKMLDTVEDSNVFLPSELEGVSDHQWILAENERREGDLLLAVNRVDKIPEGVVVNLPTKQANNLIALGYAELA